MGREKRNHGHRFTLCEPLLSSGVALSGSRSVAGTLGTCRGPSGDSHVQPSLTTTTLSPGKYCRLADQL